MSDPSHLFPILPNPSGPDGAWSNSVYQAHSVVSNACSHATRLLRQEGSDPVRLRTTSETLEQQMVPILDALGREVQDPEWANECAQCLAYIITKLNTSAGERQTLGASDARVAYVTPIDVEYTGRRGRPRKVINKVWLADATSAHRKIPLQRLAKALNIHRSTLNRSLKHHGLCRKFSEISDEDLDSVIRTFKANKPSSGLRFIQAFLRSEGLRVQKDRVRSAIQRIDGLGSALRQHAMVPRQAYRASRSGHLWHGDGHHKIIKYGIVIHGFIDGFDRMITGLRASNNNRASTVLDLLLEAVETYGTPWRLRGDRGGENILAAVWMILHRGPNRGSFLWGSSTHNQRIERLWVDVGTQFARRWRAFFLRLEEFHGLDARNPHHLWLLHSLFLGEINSDCTIFQTEWNQHAVRGTHDQTPSDMRFLSAVENGMYMEDNTTADIHPDLLQRYYGVDGTIQMRRQGLTGAGHPPDEGGGDGSDGEQSATGDEPIAITELEAAVAADQEPNVRHDPIPVPDHRNPFPSADLEHIFWRAYEEVQNEGILPPNMMLSSDEWEGGDYPVAGEIPYGTRGQKRLSVLLPLDVWYPRAVAWARALRIFEQIVLDFEL